MVGKNVAEILADHVTFELEAIDRMYLNAYVPSLQTGGGFVWFTKTQLGARVPSTMMVAPMSQRFVEAIEALLQQYNASSIDAVPVSFQGISLQEGENHGNEVFDRHYGRIFDTYAAQNRVYQLAGVASPMLPIRSLSMGLAGTDFLHHREFVGAAEDYRRSVQRVLNDDIMRNARPGVAYVAGPALWATVPEFEYTMPRASWVLSQSATSIVLLLLWLVVSCWFAVRSGRRLMAY